MMGKGNGSMCISIDIENVTYRAFGWNIVVYDRLFNMIIPHEDCMLYIPPWYTRNYIYLEYTL